MDASSPAKLVSIVKQSLNVEEGLETPTQAIALLCHANALVNGYKCIEPVDGETGGFTQDQVRSIKLPGDDIHLRYAGPVALHLKVSRMGSKIVIYAMDEADNTASFDIKADEFTGTTFPKDAASTNPLVNCFISLAQVKAFSTLFATKVLNKLHPQNGDEPDAKDSPSTSKSDEQKQEVREQRIPMPSQEEPLRLPNQGRQQTRPEDWPPELEDEHQLLQPARGQPSGGVGIGSIGADDLRPPGIDAMNPFGRGGPRLPGTGGHRGMHPTPEEFYPGSNTGPFGELPDGRAPGSAPPAGARYDPVYPGDPFGGPGRGPGHGRGGGQGPFGGGGNMFG
jgi:hypothetical protein